MTNLPIDIFKNIITVFFLGIALGLFLNVICFSYLPLRDMGKVISTFFCDIFRWISFTLSIILILYYLNNGAFRFIYIAVELFGLFAYHKLLSKYVNKFLKALTHPLNKTIEFIAGIIKKIVGFFYISIAKPKEKLYNNKEV